MTDKRLLREQEHLHDFLRKKQEEFNLGVIEVYTLQGERLAKAVNPNVPVGEFTIDLADILQVGQTGKQRSLQDSLGNGDLIKSIVPIHSKWEEEQIIGVLLVDYFIDG